MSETTTLDPAVADADAPPPPNIETDRILLATGSTMISTAYHMVAIADAGVTWLTKVPIEWSLPPHEPVRDDTGPDGVWCRWPYFQVHHQLKVGTVAELVEDFRASLTKCFHSMTCRRDDGSHFAIPSTGEASLRKQTEVFERNGIVGLTTLEPDPEPLAVMERRNASLSGVTPRQTALERDLLRRLVSTWAQRQHRFASGPTDQPDLVQELIDALVVLKEDREATDSALRAAKSRRDGQPPTPSPAVEGSPIDEEERQERIKLAHRLLAVLAHRYGLRFPDEIPTKEEIVALIHKVEADGSTPSL